MAKSKKMRLAKAEQAKSATKKELKPSRAAFHISICVIVLGLLAQLIMSVIVYPTLPPHIPADWVGASYPNHMKPAWIIFLVFPAYELVLLVIAVMTSQRDARGRRAIDAGRAVSLILLVLTFTALHAGVFHLPQRFAPPPIVGAS